jgi:hypothetical protein
MYKTYSLLEFNGFPSPKQYAILEDFATYLGVYRMQGNYKVALFELNGFYVEVWLNQVTDQLYKAEAFRAYERLDPFLISIKIPAV